MLTKSEKFILTEAKRTGACACKKAVCKQLVKRKLLRLNDDGKTYQLTMAGAEVLAATSKKR